MEVQRALFDMHPSKVARPDGFTALFFQKAWPFVGQCVTSAVLAVRLLLRSSDRLVFAVQVIRL